MKLDLGFTSVLCPHLFLPGRGGDLGEDGGRLAGHRGKKFKARHIPQASEGKTDVLHGQVGAVHSSQVAFSFIIINKTSAVSVVVPPVGLRKGSKRPQAERIAPAACCCAIRYASARTAVGVVCWDDFTDVEGACHQVAAVVLRSMHSSSNRGPRFCWYTAATILEEHSTLTPTLQSDSTFVSSLAPVPPLDLILTRSTNRFTNRSTNRADDYLPDAVAANNPTASESG